MKTRAASVIALVISVFLASFRDVASAGFDKGPPAGIVPTTKTLSDVLKANDKANGKELEPDASAVEEGTIRDNGISGTYKEISMAGDYVQTQTLGPFTTTSGFVDGQFWSQDENGLVTRVEGVHQRGSVDARALATAMTQNVDGVKLLGEVASPVAAYVVEVNPPNGRKEWIFFDKSSGLVDRTERIFPTRRAIVTYADYKKGNGVAEAWSGHYTDGDPVNDEDWHVASVKFGVPIDKSIFEIPANRQFVEFPDGVSSVKLPVSFVDAEVIVTLTIGGKGYDFLLDSGSSDINVDYAAAQKMGLTLYGKATNVAAGTITTAESIIPEVDIGQLKMHNVAVTVLPYTEQPKEGTELVGLIGYDFIASLSLRIDYDHQTLEAFLPGQYVPPANAFVIPAALDDHIPIVPAQIGNAIGEHFVLDTGADLGFVFPAFAANHPDDVRDRGAGRRLQDVDPFMYAVGVGGTVHLKPTQVEFLSLGGVRFDDWVVYVMPGNTAQEEEDYDGLIGYDFLRYFSVVFDYRNSLIYLEPNALFSRSSYKS